MSMPQPTRMPRVKRPVKNFNLSEPSQAFMRAAFAPFDFPALALEGVPDNYTGPSIVKQHCLTNTVTMAKDEVLHIAVLPTPGTAYWHCTGEDVTGTWLAQHYADFDNCFPLTRNTRDGTFSTFRYLGAALEIRPTSAVVSNAGSITAARVPIVVTERQIRESDVNQGTTTMVLSLGTQMKYIDMSPASESGYTQGPSYSAHVNDGLFTVAVNDGCWDFEKIWTGEPAIPPNQVEGAVFSGTPPVLTIGTANIIAHNGRLSAPTDKLMGFGHMNAIVVTIRASSALTFTFLNRAYVEYTVDPFSVMYNMARPSPPVDLVALALYSSTSAVLPPGLPYSQNADFWTRVWAYMKRILGQVSKVAPAFGPYGVAAGTIAEGVQQLGNLIEQL